MAMNAIDARFSAALDAASTARAPTLQKTSNEVRARAQANDFEASFMSSMYQQMFSGLQGEGPLGGNTGVGVWRSFLADEFAKQAVKKGSIGIADQVYKSLIGHQEAATKQVSKTQSN